MVKETNKYILIRPDAFLFCFGIDLPISFIPLYAEDLYQPILGITKETIMSMPISVSMFFTTLAFLIGGFWVDKKGWQHAHWFGVFFAGIGQIFSGIASSALQFIFYRAVYGFGYGLVFLSYMGFVYSNTDERNRTMGFASMSAGMYSGSICGGAIGGMLAERIGFQNVFFVSAFFILATLLYTTIFMKETYHHPKPSQAAATLSSLKSDLKLIARFLFDRNVFALLFLLSIPAAITLVGVLYYISPIYLDRLGTSQANIARILMINGVFMIYISPLLSPIMDKARDKRMFLVASGLIGGCGMFVCFFFLKGLSAIIFAILILSFAASIGHSTRTVYALQQQIAVEIGGGKAMSLYRTIDRLGWVLGPLILSVIITSGEIERNLSIVGIIYIVLTLMFWFASKSDNTQ